MIIQYSIANNELGPKGISYLTTSLLKCTSSNKFTSIDISGVRVREDLLPGLFNTLARVKGE